MENLVIFLFRASISLALFYMIYWFFLRKSTHFLANRIFLIVSLLATLLIAAFPVHYTVETTVPEQVFSIPASFDFSTPTIRSIETNTQSLFTWNVLGWALYILGILFVFSRLIIQSLRVKKLINESDSEKKESHFIHTNSKYHLPFSFFNHIFIHTDSYN